MNNKNLTQNLMIFIPIIMVGLGIIMIYSASSIFAAERFNDNAYFFKKQAIFGVFGIICMLLVMKIPYSFFNKIAYPLWFACLSLLIILLIPGIGTKVGGAVRWLRLGPLSFQPSEMAKLAVIILLASSLSKKDPSKIKTFSIGVLPHLIFVLPVCFLIILQPDFGTSVIILSVFFTILFAAGVPFRYLSLMGIIAGSAGTLLIICKGYRFARLLTFLNPWEHSTGSGFQIVQSFLAFGSGGLWGTGLGRGTQKLFYLPEPHTDFILSVIGEELGFVGVITVATLMLILIVCGINIAMHARDMFGTYLAVGITSLIGLQATINMCVVMGLLPTKGIPLPFISYGGTSLLLNLTSVGILLSISRQCNFKVKK